VEHYHNWKKWRCRGYPATPPMASLFSEAKTKLPE
jgi:hypothetical protein